MNKKELVNLENSALNGLGPIFQRELDAVIKNIMDTNTSATAKRTITLKVEINPYKDRFGAEVNFTGQSTLAARKGEEAKIGFERNEANPSRIDAHFKQELTDTLIDSLGVLRDQEETA